MIDHERERYQRYLASREWAELREAVRERCNDTCERCFRNPMYAVHHLTYARKYSEWMIDLLGVCWECHEWLHAKRGEDPAAGWVPKFIPYAPSVRPWAEDMLERIWRLAGEMAGRISYRGLIRLSAIKEISLVLEVEGPRPLRSSGWAALGERLGMGQKFAPCQVHWRAQPSLNELSILFAAWNVASEGQRDMQQSFKVMVGDGQWERRRRRLIIMDSAIWPDIDNVEARETYEEAVRIGNALGLESLGEVLYLDGDYVHVIEDDGTGPVAQTMAENASPLDPEHFLEDRPTSADLRCRGIIEF